MQILNRIIRPAYQIKRILIENTTSEEEMGGEVFICLVQIYSCRFLGLCFYRVSHILSQESDSIKKQIRAKLKNTSYSEKTTTTCQKVSKMGRREKR